MKRNPSKQATTIPGVLLISIGLMLSCNVFAADSTPGRVTQPEFNAAIANLQAQIDKLTTKKQIGNHFGGGIIFYIDETGQHGLIASLSDQSTDIQWYNGIYKVTGATGDGVGAGATNTAIIIAAQSDDNPTGNFAAKVAADFSVQEDGLTACTSAITETCYGDWYLPSKYELSRMYYGIGLGSILGNVGSFDTDFYWSSTELSSSENGKNDAWYQSFIDGSQLIDNKNFTLRVRAIRAF